MSEVKKVRGMAFVGIGCLFLFFAVCIFLDNVDDTKLSGSNIKGQIVDSVGDAYLGTGIDSEYDTDGNGSSQGDALVSALFGLMFIAVGLGMDGKEV